MLVSEAQEEDGCDCCVPIKSKWQSDLGEAQRGYIFSQPFSQGCYFPRLRFIYFFILFLLRRWSHGCLPSIGTPVYRAELMRQSGLSAEGVKRGIDCFTSLAFLTSLFSSCVNKRPSFAHWVQGRELDSASEIRAPRCLGSCCSLSCWMKQLFFCLF